MALGIDCSFDAVHGDAWSARLSQLTNVCLRCVGSFRDGGRCGGFCHSALALAIAGIFVILCQVKINGDMGLASRDPDALRYCALLAFVMAVLFGSVWRVGSLGAVISEPAVALASGPVWEGWVEPPAYTQLPALYLNELENDVLQVPRNSLVTLRFYGELGVLSLEQTVSGIAAAVPQETSAVEEFSVTTSGQIVINGEGGRSWTVQMTDDAPPSIALTQAPDVTALGVMSLPYHAQDDYGVTSGRAVIALDWDKLDRRFGLRIDPEQRSEIDIELTVPISGDRRDFSDVVIQDFSQHPWSNLPVLVTATVTDLLRQQGAAPPFEMRLPGRRFFDPLAAAVIELRRDLLWSARNAAQVAVVMRAISHAFAPPRAFAHCFRRGDFASRTR